MIKHLKREAMIPVNTELVGLISPVGLHFKHSELTIGAYRAKGYGVIRYPASAEMGWLAPLTNIPSTAAVLTFQPIDASTFIEGLSRSITLHRGIMASSKDPLAVDRAKRAAKDAERIMTAIDANGESVGLVGFFVLPMAPDEKTFEKTKRKMQGAFSLAGCKLRTLSALQEDTYEMISPACPIPKNLEEIAGRIMPLSTFTGGFPFASSGFNDGSGYCFGKDTAGGLVIVDPWKRGGDRTNTNLTVMGVAGVGKSTVVKHLALSEYMRGTKVIFIDVENEYRELTEKVNGDVISCGGSAGGMLNPLQVRPSPREDNEEGFSDLALYLKTLDTFFSLYLSELTDSQKALLKDSLIELYNIYNIGWNTDATTLANEDFPTFSDLYDLIAMKAEENESERAEYNTLLLLLKDAAKGSDSFLWNGVTNFNLSSRCICFDTHDLNNTTDAVKRAQYFNILTYCWKLMSENRNEKVLLICDEAYLLIDPKVPQSLTFLRNVEKRARKYEAGLVVVSHSVVDFLSPEIRMYGQALLDIPCIKILMGTDGANLKETKELYHLTEAEEELLIAKRRGEGLVLIGNKRMRVAFDIPQYKLDLIGTSGGR